MADSNPAAHSTTSVVCAIQMQTARLHTTAPARMQAHAIPTAEAGPKEVHAADGALTVAHMLTWLVSGSRSRDMGKDTSVHTGLRGWAELMMGIGWLTAYIRKGGCACSTQSCGEQGWRERDKGGGGKPARYYKMVLH